MITRLTVTYLAIFACVLAVLSFVAFLFVSQQYHSLLLPVLSTPEGQSAYAATMRRVAAVIFAFDVPLLIVVGIASAFLARVSIAPLFDARERERLFVADAAHGLRSPLATIASVAQAASNDTDARSRTAFDLISKTALDASGLIAELLTLARNPHAGLLECEPIDVGALGTQCASEFVARAGERGVALNVDAGSAIVNGDARRIRELIRNLLDNALRHARHAVTLSIANGATAATITVEDDGTGIPSDERARVFERFTRGSEHAEGTGLGLPIARWIARAHGGSLELDERAHGARLVAKLPTHRS